MKSTKSDSLIMLSIVFIILGVIVLAYCFMQPKVYEPVEEKASSSESVSTYEESKTEVEYPLNLNTATAEELSTIKGIGMNKAYAIIEYRDVIGGYTSVEQIKDISGISDSLYPSIAGYLTV